MVKTRKSTGKLPPPKRQNLADVESDADDHSDEDKVKLLARKRVKKEHSIEGDSNEVIGTARKRVKPMNSDDEGECDWDDAEPAEKRGKKEHNTRDANDEVASASASYEVAKTKPSRADRLITGPESRGILNANKTVSQKRVRKSDMGKLARMMDLPVDVFCEIAAHLTTLDLLKLSRSTRSLRSLLMSKSSKSIWHACEIGMGLPPCPSDMSEPQYANLFFEKACHACGYSRVDRTTYPLRIRLCKPCHSLNVMRGSTLAKEIFGVEVAKNYEIYTLLPWNNMYYLAAGQSVNARFQGRYFLKSDFIDIVSAYLATAPDSEERKQFVEKRHQLLHEITTNMINMDHWHGGEYLKRADVEKMLRKKREEKILERLNELGYENDELNEMRKYVWGEWTRVLNQPRELTDQLWKKLRPVLEQLIKKKRDIVVEQTRKHNRQKREDELHTLFTAFLKRHQDQKSNVHALLILCFVDLVNIPLVSELIEEGDCTIEMTASRWEVIERMLPELNEKLARQIELDCASALVEVRKDVQHVNEVGSGPSSKLSGHSVIDTSVLRHASAFFPSSLSSAGLVDFNHVLVERHRLLSERSHARPWSAEHVRPPRLLVQTTESLLASLNMAKDTTMECMDSLGQSFVCSCCDPILQSAMNWHELVTHFFQNNNLIQFASRFSGSIPLTNDHNLNHTCRRIYISPEFKFMEHEDAHMRSKHCIDTD